MIRSAFLLLLSVTLCKASPAGVEAGVKAEAKAGVNVEIRADSSTYDGPIEWSDDCECHLADNAYYDDILYMHRRYQDYHSIRDFENYVERETDKYRLRALCAGSDNQTTRFDNENGFDRLRLRPRVLRGVGVIDTTTSLLGDDVSFPLGMAPVPFLRWTDPDGEIGAARAAECEGVPYIVSAFSNTDLEEIAAAARHANLWMETYVFRDRSITQSIVERAEASGYRAVVVTTDLPVLGHYVGLERDHAVMADYLRIPNIENDESNADFYHLDSEADASVKIQLHGIQLNHKDLPKLDRHYLHRTHAVDNIELVKGPGFFKTEKVRQRYERLSECIGTFGIEEQFNYLVDPEQSWEDVRWIRKITVLPLVVRGIINGCDAIRAVESGASAIIVSNNGGRDVDTAPPAIEALSEVIEAVDVYQNVQVFMEGGVRWGTDIFKALALGADGVFIGRPFLWGMLHSGKCGVRRVLKLLRREFERDMALMGTKHVDEITSTMCVSEEYFRHRYRPADVSLFGAIRENKLECPFGYDYDEDFDPSLEDVRELRPTLGGYAADHAIIPTVH